MKKIRLIFILCGWLLFWNTAAGQVPELLHKEEFRSAAQAAIDSIYNYNFRAADRLVEPWKERHPAHPVWEMFEGVKFWWTVLADLEDRSNDDRLFRIMGRVDYHANRVLREKSDHIDALLMKIISNGYIARQYANRDEWITSINYSRKAYRAYQYLLQLQPDFPDLQLAEGLKLYYSARLPEDYPIVRTISWFFPEGDKKKGFALMKKAAEEGIFVKAEAVYFLGNINYLYEGNYNRAAGYLEQLYREYPNNGYYARYFARSRFQMRDYDGALDVIAEALERWQKNDLPYPGVLKEELLTLKGRIFYRRGQYREALDYFEEAFETGEGLPHSERRSNYVISGFYAGIVHYRNSEYEKAARYFERISGQGALPEYRKRARKYLSEINSR